MGGGRGDGEGWGAGGGGEVGGRLGTELKLRPYVRGVAWWRVVVGLGRAGVGVGFREMGRRVPELPREPAVREIMFQRLEHLRG